uniref:GmrSD restriction endonucleases N-terminal domain-containing protein n=1 Tax=Paramoeba aestuarina TaxID=180227 RepID=A0A7S4PCP7_9EUKA|mmetsp:Transcript_40257/g.63697  ORF Transcript_40257/g.63697 Transcript_40257/m.63697 type:complete len:542 (+) Transcript_40257:793-2418(+)
MDTSTKSFPQDGGKAIEPQQPCRKKPRTIPEHINDREARLVKQLAEVKAKENKNSLSHFSYTCPGLHGPGTSTDVTMVKFDAIFGPSAPPILIPLFQRTYCWEDQIEGWWRDLSGAIVNEHRVGKIIFKAAEKESKRAMVCIDGQQRITTQQLFLSSLRDAALFLKKQIATCPSSAVSSLLPEVNAFLRTVNVYLYRDVQECQRWIKERRQEQQNKEKEEETQGISSSLFHLGEKIEFCTLLPSFCDRVPFFDLVTAGVMYEIDQEERGWQKEGGEQTQLGLNLQFSKEVNETFMGKAKRSFDGHVLRSAFPSPSRSAGDLQAALKKLQELGRNAMHNMIIARIEIMNPIDYALVFLWFQEKSLFSSGSLLHNPSPGVSFRAIDLVRNLCLSPFMEYSLAQQEELYRKYWLGPIELKLGTRTVVLDGFLEKFLEQQNHHISKSERYVGSFEGKMECLRDSGIIKQDFTTPLLYAAFHSYYELNESLFAQQTTEVEKGLRAMMESVHIIPDNEEKAASHKASFLALRDLSNFALSFSPVQED